MQQTTQERRSLLPIALPAIIAAVPVGLFICAVLRCVENIPFWDDYDALLLFGNLIVESRSFGTKFLVFLAAQHTEYKLFFAHSIVWAEIALTGRVNFAFISLLGGGAIFVLAFILWCMFLPQERDLSRRLALFVPVAWLLFQLQYWESVDWPVAGMQNLWIVVFVIGAIVCLLQPSRKFFAVAILLYVLAIGALGNGILLLPVGLLILVQRRCLIRAAIWLAVSGVCFAAYAYQYDVMSSQSSAGGSVFHAFLRQKPVYALAFIGNAAAVAGESRLSVVLSLAFALVLLGLFGWLARRGYAKRNPAVAYSVLFILLTAVGVASMRGDLGMRTSVTSRYTINGAILVILAWTAICEEILDKRSESPLRSFPVLFMILGSVIFSLSMDWYGYRNLTQRRDDLVRGMAAFERSPADGPITGAANEPRYVTELREFAREVLQQSISLGVYEPPKL